MAYHVWAVTVTLLAGITGSASGGMSIALAAMSETFISAANAAANGITNAQFHVADLSQAPDPTIPWMRGGFDQVLLDPPRVGAREVLSAVAHLAPRRVVYISCHTGSLARDLGVMTQELGFRLRAAGVLDMFPHTTHVESIAVLDRT